MDLGEDLCSTFVANKAYVVAAGVVDAVYVVVQTMENISVEREG